MRGPITTHRTDEMDIVHKIKALRVECGFASGEFQERMRNFNRDGSRLWTEGANRIFRDHGLTLQEWYLLCEISA